MAKKIEIPLKKKKKDILEEQEASLDVPDFIYIPLEHKKLVSTGSTLIDLEISGGRVRGGGMPGGVLVEFSGPSSSGKTALLVEIGVSVQNKGGEVDIADPEGRLDRQFSKLRFGLDIEKGHYSRPDTVEEVFNLIEKWEPENKKKVSMFGCDSIAALSTEMEMGEGDKRGQKKAKDLASGLRKVARKISKNNKLIIFTNHEKDGEYGKTTPGGKAVGFHASLRMRVAKKATIEKEKKFHGKTIKKKIGILTDVTILKTSVDNEGRTVQMYIIHGVGIDDVRANLQYIKDNLGLNKYDACGKEFKSMDAAIKYIEENDLESELREKVIDLWEEIEMVFRPQRKPKVRF